MVIFIHGTFMTRQRAGNAGCRFSRIREWIDRPIRKPDRLAARKAGPHRAFRGRVGGHGN